MNRDRLLFDNLEEKVAAAINLLRDNEPEEGYYLAFSGGKDSCVIKQIAIESGVKFQACYNNTTIDPPELIRFIKKHHADVKWNNPKEPFFRVLENKKEGAPTRIHRWCCHIFKEKGGFGMNKIFGVRASESVARRNRWRELVQDEKCKTKNIICPIVYWKDDDVWQFIRDRKLPYCELYDQGFSRIGCIGCPLSRRGRERDFKRWPRYEYLWKKAIEKNWLNFKDVPTRDGRPRYQSKFKSADEFWNWWMENDEADFWRGDCQSGLLWTNEDIAETKREAVLVKTDLPGMWQAV